MATALILSTSVSVGLIVYIAFTKIRNEQRRRRDFEAAWRQFLVLRPFDQDIADHQMKRRCWNIYRDVYNN